MNSAEPPAPGPVPGLAPQGTELSAPRRAVLRLCAALVAALAVAHAGMMLLDVAGDFPVSEKNAERVDSWMNPLFIQDWKIFAPDPPRHNQHLEVRVKRGERFGAWTDVTAHDNAAYRRQLLPSKEDQLTLRRATGQYRRWVREGKAPPETNRAARLLRDVVLIRLADMGQDRGEGIELRLRTTPIPPPGSNGPAPASSYLPLGYLRTPG
ncbi:DUF5819 family protein [Streptomyces sp. N2-109]|uniref:DUF5819 family protein n=1 Tax=Streptomyces gossypii TaxID=2883101 RepID=A0ABT2JWX8_9ACTN|nr:DUF5819 family protein [Streptomyces gossypii]MCT2592410.1 DUF5819 family protein [Streptomyces gossypii]